jgi:hypothetical protein
MRLAERHDEPVEAHFTEGELDLEPPEELAISELDEEAILEEELDNEDLLEQDVDEDTLEETLEHLVHGGDEEDDAEDEDHDAVGSIHARAPDEPDPAEELEEQLGTEDLEESLDLVLLERMALVDLDGAGSSDEEPSESSALLLLLHTDTVGLVDVAPCRAGEFVCRSCFLVRRQVQLADPEAMVCHDCTT